MEDCAQNGRESENQDLGHQLDKTTIGVDVGASSRERPLLSALRMEAACDRGPPNLAAG